MFSHLKLGFFSLGGYSLGSHLYPSHIIESGITFESLLFQGPLVAMINGKPILVGLVGGGEGCMELPYPGKDLFNLFKVRIG
jgi:hypothetical protein